MKIKVLLVVVLLLTVVFPCLPVVAEPSRVPHEDPQATLQKPDVVGLALAYVKLFDLMSAGNYDDARGLLAELEKANIPEEMRYIIDRYREICRELNDTLSSIEATLNEASLLLSEYKFDAALQKLEEAQTSITRAWRLLEEIEQATDTLLEAMLGYQADARAALNAARARLEQMLERLRAMLEQMENKLQELLSESATIRRIELRETGLTLTVTPASAFVGESVTARGRLTSGTEVMGNRNIELTLGGQSYQARTADDGWYIAVLSVPYQYIPSMEVVASYSPSGRDFGLYVGCRSMPVRLEIQYYEVVLQASAPAVTQPGRSFEITGRVSSDGEPVGRHLRVLLDGEQMAEGTVSGDFRFTLLTPTEIDDGDHQLVVSVAAQGRYAGAATGLPLRVSRIPVSIDIQAPRMVFIPGKVQVSGKVTEAGRPVPGARVIFHMREESLVRLTEADGGINGVLKVPAGPSLVRPMRLIVSVTPKEPWYSPVDSDVLVTTVNLPYIGMALVASVTLGVLVTTRVRQRSPAPPAGTPASPSETPLPPQQEPAPSRRFSGAKGRVLSAFLQAREIIARITGLTMLPQTTLREYLKAVEAGMPGLMAAFTELTGMAEVALYSAREIGDEMAGRAEQLAVEVSAAVTKEGSRVGTA